MASDGEFNSPSCRENIQRKEAVSVNGNFNDEGDHKNFATYYRQRIAKEFANELEKLRLAPDCSTQSISVMIRSLDDGLAIYSPSQSS